DKRFEQSAKASQEFLEIIQRLEKDERISKGLKTEILRLMIRAMAKQGKTAEAAKMVDDLVKVRPNEWRNYGLRAWLERENRKYDAALKAYEQMLPLLAKDDELRPEAKDAIEAETRLDIVDTLY